MSSAHSSSTKPGFRTRRAVLLVFVLAAFWTGTIVGPSLSGAVSTTRLFDATQSEVREQVTRIPGLTLASSSPELDDEAAVDPANSFPFNDRDVVIPAGNRDQNRYSWGRVHLTPTDLATSATLASQATCRDQNLAVEAPEEQELPDLAAEYELYDLFSEDFSQDRNVFRPLSGTWTVEEEGALVQWDRSGHDLIARLAVDPPDNFSFAADIHSGGDWNGSGLIIAQPYAARRSGAVMVDFSEGGHFLRWGCFDYRTDQYRYLGGAEMPADFDIDANHRLRLTVIDGLVIVAVDEQPVGAFRIVLDGHIGFATSLSRACFDNVTVSGVLPVTT